MKGYENMPSVGSLRSGKTRRGSTRAQGETTQAMIAVNEPANFHAAITGEDAEAWVASMRDEVQSLYDQHVWDLVQRQPGQHCVDNKWVYKVKCDENNIPVRYKSRLTARGFTQIEGIAYNAISAPVVSKEAVRIVLALAAQQGWHLQQFDVKTAYLYAPLKEEIYMDVPEGLLEIWGDRLAPEEHELLASGTAVLRLNKALYGLLSNQDVVGTRPSATTWKER